MLRNKWLAWILVAGFGLVMAGCGGNDCVDVCEAEKECGSAEDKAVDCNAACDQAEAEVGKAGCKSQWEALLSCQADAGVCSLEVLGCLSQALEYSTCTDSYCDQNPTASICD